MNWTTWRGPGTTLETQPTAETPEQAAHRFYGRLIREGYRLARIWAYSDIGRNPWWVCRFEHPEKRKEPRPLCRVDGEFRPCKPEFPNGSPLLYLQNLAWNLERMVWLVEGEKTCDAAWDVGLLATTWAGGANAILRTNWTPLAGRKVIIWPDNDEAGIEAIKSLKPTLRAQGTIFGVVDVEDLGIRRHGDIADWIEQRKLTRSPDSPISELHWIWQSIRHIPMVHE